MQQIIEKTRKYDLFYHRYHNSTNIGYCQKDTFDNAENDMIRFLINGKKDVVIQQLFNGTHTHMPR
jgi:hypothetical protein